MSARLRYGRESTHTSTMSSFDLVVIGGGAAGINAAKTALKLGKSVALLDRGPLGGSCINRG